MSRLGITFGETNPIIMSWSISLIGKPENVSAALTAHSGTLSGQPKVEFDDALPHLVGLVNQNFGFGNPVSLIANGHGYAADGEQKNRTISVSLTVQPGMLV